MVELGVVEKTSMVSIKELITSPLPDYYKGFLRRSSQVILDTNRISLLVLCGDERKSLETKTNGDSTLVLRYKEKEGVLLSMKIDTENLGITQFQGSHGRTGYKMNDGILSANLFADQIIKLTEHELSVFQRIWMPVLEKIEGLNDSKSNYASDRYEKLANLLGLKHSSEEKILVKDLRLR
jgi:hypothetical protein